MIIEINALDTLFFRDGKPFTMGEETWTDAIFPPMPSVIYGALRSAYFSYNTSEIENANLSNDPTKKLRIKGIYLKIQNELFFPIPLDCVKKKSDKEKAFVLDIESLSEKEFYSNYPPLEKILISNNEAENINSGLLNKITFEEYLTLKNISELYYIKVDEYMLSEPKIGIARSKKTHTSEEGKLYRIDMRRMSSKWSKTLPQKLSIVVDFEDLSIPEKGLLKLGGEGKAVSYKKIDNNITIGFPEFMENDNNQFKIVLSTPTIFKKGWLPDWIDEETLEGKYTGFKLKLLAAAIGKPVNLGGFDMKAGKPKPMYKIVPAGSVYHFELQEGQINKVEQIFYQKAISDVYPEQGFGITYVGMGKNDRK